MPTVILLFALAAFAVAVVAGTGRAPLWVSVILLCAIELMRQLPLGR